MGGVLTAAAITRRNLIAAMLDDGSKGRSSPPESAITHHAERVADS